MGRSEFVFPPQNSYNFDTLFLWLHIRRESIKGALENTIFEIELAGHVFPFYYVCHFQKCKNDFFLIMGVLSQGTSITPHSLSMSPKKFLKVYLDGCQITST